VRDRAAGGRSDRRRRSGVLAILLFAAGCTMTHDYAVIVARDERADNDSCFRQCQQLRSGGTNRYLDCLKTCDGVQVLRETKCSEVDYEHELYRCTTEHNKSFNPFPVVLIALSVLVLGAAVGAFATR